MKKIKKVLVIGSGPIIIGQAAEFDYAGTQACQALKEEGIEVVLVNSNPATIMTDKNIASKVYIEPLTVDILKSIVIKEKPDSILPTLGGQTGLNLAMELAESNFLKEQNVKLLGTSKDAIKKAEDRLEFKKMMESIDEPIIKSEVVNTLEDAIKAADEIGYPVIIRPAYTLGGSGGGIVDNKEDLIEIVTNGLNLSRVHQVLIEKCISGWKEIEYEVMRDKKGNCITVCNMENIDPVGIHTGDSIVVAPSQTLCDKEYQMLRTSALKIINALKIEGGCNVQFALNPNSFEYAVIEVNPRVSRSSALASKATGYPIAKVATKIAIGYGLDEIKNAITGKTYACFEPTLDYVVVKIPKWPFDKFVKAKKILGTQMKSTGEVMAISTSLEGGLMKAIRSIDLGMYNIELESLKKLNDSEIEEKLYIPDTDRLFVIAEALRRNISLDKINDITKIDKFFINKINNLIKLEEELKVKKINKTLLLKAKKYGYTDALIAKFSNTTKEKIKELRNKYNIHVSYKMVDTCAAEFEAMTPYYYSTYEEHNESIRSNNKKVLVIGSGPIRIGQGIEFDYCSVHAIWAFKNAGYETIIANNNPETVSTDFDTSDKLYFEPLTVEDVENIIETEKPDGIVLQFGGQTAIKLVKHIKELNIPIFGTSAENMDAAEDREKFDKILEECNILRPKGKTVYTKEEALEAANTLGYPVLVRPSYVLGGQGMEIAYNDSDIIEFMEIINRTKQENPILIDKYMMGKEIEVDAICDGEDILIPGIMEHIERAGIHSGDSISVYPSQNIEQKYKDIIVDYTKRLAKSLNVIGIINIQFILYKDEIYVIEVNPRSSRTVPYISKVTNVPMINLATQCILGNKLKNLNYGTGLYKESNNVAVKVPVFSFSKLHDVDTCVGPEMKSTGEVLGIASNFSEALYKGLIATGLKIPRKGNILISVRDTDKDEIIPIAKEFKRLGFNIYATNKTALKLKENNIDCITVNKIKDSYPNILDLIQSGDINIVINTPTRGKQSERDGFKIRRKSVEHSIPCFTSLDTAMAIIEYLKFNKKEDVELINI